MHNDMDGELLLGKHTPVVDEYSPGLLYPIARQPGRESIVGGDELPFYGADLWHAYEISWLDDAGVPQVRVGRFLIPANSPNLVESKSFKLYLNSLNSTRFTAEEEVRGVIVNDVSAAAGAAVELELLPVASPLLAGAELTGVCIDAEVVVDPVTEPAAGLLECGEATVEEKLYSHLLRSLCPVTGQPDWATVWIHYRGPVLDRGSLLRYIIAYRQHQEFHEQCVERMFVDVLRTLEPQLLEIQAFYTRRGGLDINPLRSTDPAARPQPRLNRQ
jgi:7-cyano-7-deazaguanine reductase